MKRALFLILLSISIFGYSQERVYVGGEFGISHNTDDDITSFRISPNIGYKLNNKFDIGTYIGYRYLQENEDDGIKSYAFSISPYLRYYTKERGRFNVFFDGSVGYSYSDNKYNDSYINLGNKNGIEVGVRPGIFANLFNNISVISRIGFIGYRKNYSLYETGFDASLNLSNIDIGLIINL